MVQVPQRTGFSGPTLVRLLTRLTEVDAPESRQSLSDRLSHWLGWTDAIALSAALNGEPPAVPRGQPADGSAEAQECERVRATLIEAIAGKGKGAATRNRARAPARPAPRDEDVEYTEYRQRYQALQQTMENTIAVLRGRLRAALAARGPALTRLAVVDAIMERSLGARERTLLGAVPTLLERHFERLRQAALAGPQEAGDAPAPQSGAWLATFGRDMRSVLLAELDIRLQPVEGLLAALRAS